AKHWLAKSPHLQKPGDISKSYRAAFAHIKSTMPDIFSETDEIELDPVAVQYVDRQFEAIDLENCRGDIFGELYEAFAGSGTKVNEGQFFTPTAAVNLLVEITDPKAGQVICDPACGAGGFLVAVAKHLTKAAMPPSDVAKSLFGIEKDEYLARLARGRLALSLDKM